MDTMELILELLLILVFLILKGFFSGSEIAMVNCDKLKMRHQAKMGNAGAKLVLKLFKTPDVILGTTLVGTNIATVTISTLAALMFIGFFGPRGDLISVLVFTPFLLILGEIVPKSVYQQKADAIAPIIIYGLRFFSLLFYPVIFIFSRVARIATRLVGGNSGQHGDFITREEIRMLLEMSETSTSVSRRFDKKRVGRIIRFAETTVGETMIPLAEVVGINEEATMPEAMEMVWKYGFNRLPVFRGNLTNVIGVLTLDTWDLMEPDLEKKSLEEFIHNPLYISPRQTIDQTLPMMRARDDHMAIVVDEFGSATGILTMEDVLEEVVGEIDVGYDFEEYHPKRSRATHIHQEGDDEFIVDGRTPMSQINDVLHTHFPLGEAHTIAGLILNRLRTIPRSGASIVEDDFRFTVQDADERSILKVHIQRV